MVHISITTNKPHAAEAPIIVYPVNILKIRLIICRALRFNVRAKLVDNIQANDVCDWRSKFVQLPKKRPRHDIVCSKDTTNRVPQTGAEENELNIRGAFENIKFLKIINVYNTPVAHPGGRSWVFNLSKPFFSSNAPINKCIIIYAVITVFH